MRGAVLGALLVLTAAGCGRDGENGQSDAYVEPCPVSGCGGDITGTWDVTGLCVHMTSQVMTGIPECDAASKAAFESAKVVPASARIVFADASYTESGTARVTLHYVYTNTCLNQQSGLNASADTCNEVQTNLVGAGQPAECALKSETCACDLTQEIPLSQSGSYTVKGSVLSMDDELNPFCVHGDAAEVRKKIGGFSGSLTLSRR